MNGEVWSKIDLTSVEGEKVREYLNTWTVFKPEGLTRAKRAGLHH